MDETFLSSGIGLLRLTKGKTVAKRVLLEIKQMLTKIFLKNLIDMTAKKEIKMTTQKEITKTLTGIEKKMENLKMKTKYQ